MTKRRPHWSDDLIDSVVHAISDNYDYEYRAYAVIAAVEDWMDANDNPLPHVLNECLQWLDAERAAIQRVREVCDKDSFWINHAKTGGWGKALTVAQVLAALEGDSEQ